MSDVDKRGPRLENETKGKTLNKTHLLPSPEETTTHTQRERERDGEKTGPSNTRTGQLQYNLTTFGETISSHADIWQSSRESYREHTGPPPFGLRPKNHQEQGGEQFI